MKSSFTIYLIIWHEYIVDAHDKDLHLVDATLIEETREFLARSTIPGEDCRAGVEYYPSDNGLFFIYEKLEEPIKRLKIKIKSLLERWKWKVKPILYLH